MELFESKSKVVFWIIRSLVFIFSGALPAAGQIFPNSPEPWRSEYEISLKGFEFSHPATVIEDRILDNGWHQVEWDGTDSNKNLVPPGIYFCNFQIGSHRYHIPLMLIK